MKNKHKQEIREKLWRLMEDQACIVKNQESSVLDFWGGGLFADYVIDQIYTVENQLSVVLYELDNNPQLFPALRDYANRKNHRETVKNHCYFVLPFCGSLAEFVQRKGVKNHDGFDLIWLDYCGTLGREEEKDIELCRGILKDDGILAITAFSAREKMGFAQNRHAWIEMNVKKSFPSFHIYKKWGYMNGRSPMTTYVYRRKYRKIKDTVTVERFLEETGLERRMFV